MTRLQSLLNEILHTLNKHVRSSWCVRKNIQKITNGQGDDYTIFCLLDLSKWQALDADSKAVQQINFTGNLSGNNNRLIFFIIEEAKETILHFSEGAVKAL